ncbi:MAG: DUF2927 domain-containing protein [Pseudomonadota bacterium]
MRGALLAAPVLLGACGVAFTPRSATIAAEYDRYTEGLIASGLLRTERAPSDAPFTDQDLMQNFERIAFAVEAFQDQPAEERPLRRWTGPLRYTMANATRTDARRVSELMARIGDLTGMTIVEDEADFSFLVLFLDSEERSDLARSYTIEGAETLASAMQVPHRVSPCHGHLGGETPFEISSVLIVINDETSGRLRASCIEEEIVQALGLTNDDPGVRPSMFNDDEEFAFMTRHDELLLQMLYHPLLQPGMSADEARPLLPAVLADVKQRDTAPPVQR